VRNFLSVRRGGPQFVCVKKRKERPTLSEPIEWEKKMDPEGGCCPTFGGNCWGQKTPDWGKATPGRGGQNKENILDEPTFTQQKNRKNEKSPIGGRSEGKRKTEGGGHRKGIGRTDRGLLCLENNETGTRGGRKNLELDGNFDGQKGIKWGGRPDL